MGKFSSAGALFIIFPVWKSQLGPTIYIYFSLDQRTHTGIQKICIQNSAAARSTCSVKQNEQRRWEIKTAWLFRSHHVIKSWKTPKIVQNCDVWCLSHIGVFNEGNKDNNQHYLMNFISEPPPNCSRFENETISLKLEDLYLKSKNC